MQVRIGLSLEHQKTQQILKNFEIESAGLSNPQLMLHRRHTMVLQLWVPQGNTNSRESFTVFSGKYCADKAPTKVSANNARNRFFIWNNRISIGISLRVFAQGSNGHPFLTRQMPRGPCSGYNAQSPRPFNDIARVNGNCIVPYWLSIVASRLTRARIRHPEFIPPSTTGLQSSLAHHLHPHE